MACKSCRSDIFKQKLGRCTRCIKQLAFLSIGGWLTWFEFFSEQPYQIEAIAAFMATIAFSGLLSLHLVIFLWRKGLKK